MKLLKKILVAIILITVVAASATLIQRHKQLDQRSEIEIVLDAESYLELKALEPETSLSKLKDKGVSTLAIYQKTLEDFKENGSLERIEGLDLIKADKELKRVLKDNNISTDTLSNSALFAVLGDSLKNQLDLIAAELQKNYAAEIIKSSDYNLLYFPNWTESLNDLSLGYNSQLAAEARKAGLKIAYRSGNELNSLSALKNLITSLNASFLIFDGEELSGYPGRIEKTAEIMEDNNLIFGAVEAFIADQSGTDKLSRLSDYKLLRTHSMQQEEVEQASDQEIINRYLLSVRERSVSLIYHKPYLKGDNILEKNLELLGSLKSELKAEGYQIGGASPADYYSNSTAQLLAVLFGVTAAGILLLHYFSSFNYLKIMNIFFILAAAAAFILLAGGREILLRQITALGAAVVFPSLAVIVFLLEKNKGGEKLEGGLGLFYLFINFSAAVATALVGGLFVSSALNSSAFIFKVYNFRGVKLAFLLPLVIISIYYLLNLKSGKLKEELPVFLESVIKIKHLILAAVLALIAVVYIGRTGNFPLFPVPAWELTIRSFLEKLLYVRPRFKEFLIGHPLFLFSVYLGAKKRKELYFYPVLMLASVGVITTANTFSHLHTPIVISLLRTFHAYWLSFFTAAVLILVYKLSKKLFQKYYLNGVKG